MKQTKIFLALLTVSAMFALTASAQPYYTNSTAASGGYQYNDIFTTPLVPSDTIARQQKAGINVGTFAAGTALALTNSFPANSYTVAPTLTANASGTATVNVTSVTTTNFILTASATNVVVYWQAIGH